MNECRTCGVALALHELELCQACWDARENDDDVAKSVTPQVDELADLVKRAEPASSADASMSASPTPGGLRLAALYYATRPGADEMLRAAADRLEQLEASVDPATPSEENT